MRKNKHRRFIPAVEYLREPILLEAERATKLPLRLALFHLTSQADRNGVVPLDYEAIEARAPGDDFDWSRIVDLLGAAGFLSLFACRSETLIQLSGWHRMQSPHDKEKTDLPAPPNLNRYLTPQKLDWKPWQRAAGVNVIGDATPVDIGTADPPEVFIADQLVTAAAGNVSTSATDITPILDLMESGITLESILQSVRDWVSQDQTKLNSWGEEWLLTSIKTDWANRPAAQPQSTDEHGLYTTPQGPVAIISPAMAADLDASRPDLCHACLGRGQFLTPCPACGKIKPAYPINEPPRAVPAPPPTNPPPNLKADGKMYADPTFYDEPGEAPIKSLRDTSPAYNAAVEQQLAADETAASIPPKNTAEMGGALSGVSLPLISPAGVPWSDLLDGYVAGNLAWDAGWGPRPGAPGCRVPVEMLTEYGLVAGSVPLIGRS